MKLTKDNIIVGFESVDFISTPDNETKKQMLQDQKLRELLEKWIDRPECTYQTHKYLKSILEASKK